MLPVSDSKKDGRVSERACPECGKVVHGGGGLYAHLLLAHGIRRPNITTRLRQENEQLKADIVWRETEVANQKLKFEQEIARLQKLSAIDEFMAGEQERSEERWARAKCPYCGKSVGEHIEVTDHDSRRKGFMCPTKQS